MGVRDYDRFMRWFARRVRTRGAMTGLATYLGYEKNWTGRAINGKPKPTTISLEQACNIASFFNPTLVDVIKADVPVGVTPITVAVDVAEALRDPLVTGAVEALQNISDQELRAALVQVLRGSARPPPLAMNTASTKEIAEPHPHCFH